MSGIDEIKTAIEALPKTDYIKLRRWFSEKDWQKWDKEIEEDSKLGKLDFLIEEVLEEKRQGKLRDL